jgi:hypothetical protein
VSSLETSVTLEDVLIVVEAKRVPLAPELAGYLALEIADGTDAGSGNVDPKTVFISEEGTVALVRPKRDFVTGDAEASVRSLLTQLLDASGSGTPALGTAAKRKPGNGLPALVEELEAALIPVNRAAGRRALARLVREVKRVLLGVGRNASAPPVHNRPEARAPMAAPHARPALRKRDSDPKAVDVSSNLAQGEVVARRIGQFEEEPATAKHTNQLDELASNSIDGRSATNAESEPKVEAGKSASGPSAPPPPPKRDPIVAELRPEGAGPSIFGGDEVDSLLDSFGVSSSHGDKQMARELKAIAGLSPTPPPPDAKTLAELTKDIGKDLPKRLQSSSEGDSVEALLALTDASGPIAAPAATKAPAPPAVAPAAPSAPPSPPFGSASPALRQPAEAAPPPKPKPAPAPAPHSSASSLPRTKAPEGAPAGSPSATGKRSRSTSEAHRPRAPKTGMAMLVFALFVLAGGTVAIWKFAPQVFTGKKPTPGSASAPPALSVLPPPKCKVALVLTDVPANAEILLRTGQAPIDVERMPVGTRLELVATAEGYSPRRAVIKGESPWDKGPDGKPRIEVPIQLDPSKAKPGTVDPWPAAEPGSQVGGSGAPGTVHVVSNVRGAEIWLLAGLGPEARIDQLRCDADIDVLFAGPPALRRRLHVSEKDVAATAADASGNKVVSISAKESSK